jgi:hypothetical protein
VYELRKHTLDLCVKVYTLLTRLYALVQQGRADQYIKVLVLKYWFDWCVSSLCARSCAAVLSHSTGTLKQSAAASIPVILVLVQGRQRVLNGAAQHADAVVNAMLPGPWVSDVITLLVLC